MLPDTTKSLFDAVHISNITQHTLSRRPGSLSAETCFLSEGITVESPSPLERVGLEGGQCSERPVLPCKQLLTDLLDLSYFIIDDTCSGPSLPYRPETPLLRSRFPWMSSLAVAPMGAISDQVKHGSISHASSMSLSYASPFFFPPNFQQNEVLYFSDVRCHILMCLQKFFFCACHLLFIPGMMRLPFEYSLLEAEMRRGTS